MTAFFLSVYTEGLFDYMGGKGSNLNLCSSNGNSMQLQLDVILNNTSHFGHLTSWLPLYCEHV